MFNPFLYVEVKQRIAKAKQKVDKLVVGVNPKAEISTLTPEQLQREDDWYEATLALDFTISRCKKLF